MARFTREEIEEAFRVYWRTGAVEERWDDWVDLFAEDAVYVEHMYGNMQGRETIRRWIVPVMGRFPEVYTAYEWHMVDPDLGRVVVYMQNRRDHPSGTGTCDFPGVTILDYAGGGLWRQEEDFYTLAGRDRAMAEYEEARLRHDPEHPKRATRRDWGRGPAWTQGPRRG
ncbi:MAG: nuclear transport factor 2 family protein [Alphaproteobacteria bacterium]